MADLDLSGLFDSGVGEGMDLTGFLGGGSAAADAGSATGGFWDALTSGAKTFGDVASKVGSGFGDFAKTVLPIAQVGTGVLGAVTGANAAATLADQAKTAKAATAQQLQSGQKAQALAAPLTTYGESNLAKASAGEIPAASQAMIDQWKDGAKQQAVQQFEQMGLGDSQMLKDKLAQIEQMAVAMKQGALTDEQQLGLQAFGGATGALGTAAGASGGAGQAAQNQETSMQQLIAQANQQFAKLAGSQ